MKNYPIRTEDIVDKNYEHEIINQKYDFIEEVIDEVLMNKAQKEERTEKIDQWMTHPVWGMPIFFGIMAVVFLLTFAVGDWIAGGFEIFIAGVANGIQYGMELLHLSPTLISLVCDGIIAGVGGILTFLPNIFMLFLALAFLEDSGYMSRVAYVMDGLMGKMDFPDGLLFRAAWFRMHRTGHYERQNTGRHKRPASDYYGDTIYVVQRQASNLCFVFQNVFREICDGSSFFHVCNRTGRSHLGGIDLQ